MGPGSRLRRVRDDRCCAKVRVCTVPGGAAMSSIALPLEYEDAAESPTRRALRRLLRRKGAVVGMVVIAAFILLAVFAPLVSPYDPTAQGWTTVRKAPSAAHWFGTDEVGRDVLTRVIYGARASLLAGVISVTIA